MSKEYFNYGETFCDAVDIIVSEKLKTLGYDITKVCTVIDDTYKKLGRYTVQEETIKYEAYSIEVNYNIGDSVLVIIPNGDYSMQKNIIGKAMIEDDLTSSTLYESPLSTILDFTGDIIDADNIINKDGTINKEFSLLANNPNRTMKLLYSIEWDKYAGYERMGVSVDFQTWLSEYNVQSGNYGLLFYFYKKNATLEDIEKCRAAYSYTFNIHDILGNPYQFDTYYTQEKVLDISYLTDVSLLDIYFYQDNDFIDPSGELIPYLIEDDDEFSSGETYEQELNDNLYINNLKLYLGYPMGAFSGDELKLTADSLSYSTIAINNSKNLKLRWVHQVEENKYVLLDDSSDCELYWVRSGDTQQTISNIVGNYWNDQDIHPKDGNKFEAVFDLDNNNLTKNIENRVKVVGRIQKEDGNWAQYDSNIVTFVSEDPRIDQTTADALSGLSIRCADGTEGNYLMYNQNSEIINEGQGQGFNRKFEILYKGIKLAASEISNEIEDVVWTLPINTTDNDSYTMLLYKPGDLRSTGINTDIDLESLTSNLFQRTINGEDRNYDQNYSIQNTWYISNAHNTISCQVTTKQGIIYKTSKDLIFGKANSQGSNLSLVIQFTENKNAYEVTTVDNNNILDRPLMNLKGLIYDLSGNLITSTSGSWEWIFLAGNDFMFTRQDGTQYGENEHPETQVVKLRLHDTANLSTVGYNVIQVTYREGDQEVSALYPIPIKTLFSNEANITERCQSFEGARRIIYNAQGIPSYYTDIYKLINNDGGSIEGLSWNIQPKDDGKSPTLKEVNRNNNTYFALLANPVYVKDYNYQVYIVAKNGSTIYWIQPILIMQSEHELALINNWNGTMELNEESGTIMSTMVAAGKVDEGKFSGIMLGDVQNATEAIGLYGISKGDITFSLTDNGLASFDNVTNTLNTHISFGTDNRILSHGSPTFNADGQETGCSNHLLFEIDERFLEFKSGSANKGGIKLSTGNPYLTLLDEDTGHSVLSFTTNTFKLESPGYSASSGLQLDIKNGTIIANNKAVKLSNGNNYIGTVDNGTNLLKLGNLRISKGGTVYYSYTEDGTTKESTLTAYINKLVTKAIEDSK